MFAYLEEVFNAWPSEWQLQSKHHDGDGRLRPSSTSRSWSKSSRQTWAFFSFGRNDGPCVRVHLRTDGLPSLIRWSPAPSWTDL